MLKIAACIYIGSLSCVNTRKTDTPLSFERALLVKTALRI